MEFVGVTKIPVRSDKEAFTHSFISYFSALVYAAYIRVFVPPIFDATQCLYPSQNNARYQEVEKLLNIAPAR
jgi:hypothetical protein